MLSVIQDVRYAFRMLAKNLGFTAIVVATLALGIGANSAIFTVISGVVLRSLPFDHPDDLVMVGETSPESPGEPTLVSYLNFVDWQAQNDVFEAMGLLGSCGYTLTGLHEPERIRGAMVSSGFFSVLKTQAAFGRTFQPEEDVPGSDRLVVVSDRLWRHSFGGDPELVGRTLTLDGEPFTVIGILPAGFDFPLNVSGAEVWTQAWWTQPWLDSRFVESRGAHSFRVVARLKEGISIAGAQAEMDTIASRLEQQYPSENAGAGVILTPLHERVVGDARAPLLVLMGAVGLVLLIACANVANLLLARGTGRHGEIGIRAALGAGRFRLARLLLTESVLLALAGGALGLLLAVWAKEALMAIVPADLPRVSEIGLDWSVLGFTLVVSLLAGVLFGLAPALRVLRLDPATALKEVGRASTRSSRHRLGNAFVVGEMAMTLVLLIGAGLLMRSFGQLTGVPLGFDPQHVLTFRMTAPSDPSTTGRQRALFYQQVLERMESLPGAQAASASTTLPHTNVGIALSARLPDHPDLERPVPRYDAVSAGFFRTMGIPLKEGRVFTAQDTRGRPGVMVVNEAFVRMARQLLPDRDPIGLRVAPGGPRDDGDPESYQIVGIVGDVRDSVYEEPEAHMYVPLLQQTWPSAAFALRTNGDPENLIGGVRSELAMLSREEAPYSFHTMEQHLADRIAPRRFGMLLLGVFAVVALTLATIGIYGLLSYTVAQRTHEIGVRMALGAQRSDVLRSVLKRGLVLIGIGIGSGLLLAFATTHVLSSMLYKLSPTDPVTFVGVLIVLVSVAVLACYVPARRATKVDPMIALRCE